MSVNTSQMCLLMSVFVPSQLYLSVELHYKSSIPKVLTILDLSHNASMSEIILSSEIYLMLEQTTLRVQFAVNMSANATIKQVTVTNGSCNTASNKR